MKKEALKLANKLASSWSPESSEVAAYMLAAAMYITDLVVELERLEADIATLSQEHTSMRARNERLEAENIGLHQVLAKQCNGFCGKYECKENQTNCKRIKK